MEVEEMVEAPDAPEIKNEPRAVRGPAVRRENNRKHSITVRLTEEEDALVTAGARIRGVSKSDYLRQTLRRAVVEAFSESGKTRTR